MFWDDSNSFWKKKPDPATQSVQPGANHWRAKAGEAYGPLYQAAARYGIDPNLVFAVAKTESGFNPRARSKAGAAGLMQLMPGTAKDLGVTDVYDPRQSAEGGARYLKKMMDMFGGRAEHALAGYNWGPGNTQKWLSAGADPAKLPLETQKYINLILGKNGGSAMNWPAPQNNLTLAPAAGEAEESPTAAYGQNSGLNRMTVALGLLQAGANISAANRPRFGYGPASLGELLGAGAGGFASGAGGGMAYQNQAAAQAHQAALEQKKAEMEAIKAAREMQQMRAQEAYAQSLPEEERLLYMADMDNAAKQIQGTKWSAPSYQAVQGTDEYGNPSFGIFDARSGQMINQGNLNVHPTAAQTLKSQESFALPEDKRQEMALVEQIKNSQQEPQSSLKSPLGAFYEKMDLINQARHSLSGKAAPQEATQQTKWGQAYDGAGRPVEAPAGARWGAPYEGILPDGKKAMVQTDTTGRFYRPIGPSMEEAKTMAENQAKVIQDEKRKAANRPYQNIILEDAGRLRRRLSEDSSSQPLLGFWAESAAKIPGSATHDFSMILSSLRSQIGTDKLQVMRDSSPTGAGLGNITEAEGAKLDNSLGALSMSMSKDQFLYNLKRFECVYADIVHGPGNWQRDAETEDIVINQQELPAGFTIRGAK